MAVLDVFPMPMVLALDSRCTALRGNRGLHELLGEGQLEKVTGPLERAARTGRELRDVELDLVRADGTPVAVLANAIPIRERDGTVRGAVEVLYDVTERRRAEADAGRIREALEVSEHRYRLLAEALPQFVWIAAADGPVEYVNQHWVNFTGLTREASRYDGWREVLHPDDVLRSEAMWQAAQESGDTFEAQLRFRRSSDGTYRWMLLRATPIHEEPGGALKWFGTGIDIDDQKRAEESLRFLTDAGNLLASSLDVHLTLTHLAELAVSEIADWCAVYLRERDGTIRPVAITHKDRERTSFARELYLEYPVRDDEPIAHAIRTSESLLFSSISPEMLRQTAVDDRQLELFEKLGMRSAMVVPLRAREANVGAIWLVSSERGRTFGPPDMRVANLLAKRAAIAVENAYLYEEEQRSTQRLRFLAEASKGLAGSLDLQTTLDTLVRTVVSALADWSIINLAGEDGTIRAAAVYHADPSKSEIAAQLRGREYAESSGAFGTAKALRTGQPVLVENLAPELLGRSVRPDVLPLVRRLGGHSAIVVPIKTRAGVIGSLTAMWSDTPRTYSADDLPLFEDLARRAAVAIENAQLYEREHRVANTLQQAFLPRVLPQVAGLEFSVVYAPGLTESEIGGDWYDAFTLEDGRVIVSIGDVAGRGLHAAITMGKIRQAIRAFALMRPDPAAILDAADMALRLESPESMATALIGLVDPVEQTLTFAGAGHPYPLLRGADGTIVDLAYEGLPLGLRRHDEPRSVTVDLPTGSLLVLYTDGLTEATRDVEEGERRMHEALRSSGVLEAPDTAAAIKEFVLREGHRDDVAILTLGVNSMRGKALVVELPAEPGSARIVRQALRTVASGLKFSSNEEFAMQVAVGEAVMNAIEHAYGVKKGVFRLTAWMQGDALVVEVEDDGRWRPARNEGRGRGLKIMKEVCRSLDVVSQDGKSLIRLVIPVAQP